MNFDIKDFDFSNPEQAISIAEIGVNHNCDLEIAKKLVREAKKAEAAIVKFQAFKASEEISKFAGKCDYQKETNGDSGSQLEMAQKLELTHEQLAEIRNFCFAEEMPFLCSVFDRVSLQFLVGNLGVKSLKIASSEVTNHPFLAEIASTGVGIILSTGASTLAEVGEAVKVIQAAGKNELVLLHCVSSYPAPMEQLNLRAMKTMKDAFQLPIGYSDHSVGIEAPIIATALGAVLVEKHFTISREMEGPDHRASIEPHELKAMTKGMWAAFNALGNGGKIPASSEIGNLSLFRKSLVVTEDLPAGHILERSDLSAKRPLNGIEPFELEGVLGKKLKNPLTEDEPLQWENLE